MKTLKPVAEASWLFTLEVPGDMPKARAGQFVQVETPGDEVLRRPFSVAGAPDRETIELLMEIRGDGTRALAALGKGDELAVSGPLGRPFEPHPAGAAAALVAGGIGVAGLRMLANELVQSGVRTTAFIGARSAGGLLDSLLPEPRDAFSVERATDDGSAGFTGTVCDLFGGRAAALPRGSRVYLCGPRAMIDVAGRTALAYGHRAYALLEETMACGVGACRGCVVATRRGYRAVCSDGPVFDMAELLSGEGADA